MISATPPHASAAAASSDLKQYGVDFSKKQTLILMDAIQSFGAKPTIPKEADTFISKLDGDEAIHFQDFIAMIDECYDYRDIELKNGAVVNKKGENVGTSKLLSFAALAGLNEHKTLKLWGQYYVDVVKTPDGSDHGNIRNFILTGWNGVNFEKEIALTHKIAK
jgi:hypothetical protein